MSWPGLAGRRVVVTRPREQAREMSAALEALGAEVIELPTISIHDPPSWNDLDWSLRKLSEGFFAWVLFTSTNAVEKVMARIWHAGKDARSIGRTRIGAVGPATAEALERWGLRADLVPDEHTGLGLARALGRGSQKVLLPRSDAASDDIVERLEAHGWSCEAVVAYVTDPPDPDAPAAVTVRAGEFDAVTFTSGSAVRGFVDLAGPPHLLSLSPPDPPDRLVACIGPSTARVCGELGVRVDVQPGEHGVRALAAALADALGAALPDPLQ